MKYLTILITLMLSLTCSAKNMTLSDVTYEIEGGGTGTQGTYLVKVAVTTKDKKLPDYILKACAVHGVLFRGFTNGRQHQKPMAGSPTAEAAHADFFKSFFYDNATYNAYASMVPGSKSIIKSGKEYKISAVFSISKELLHKDLEAAGIIRGLNAAF